MATAAAAAGAMHIRPTVVDIGVGVAFHSSKRATWSTVICLSAGRPSLPRRLVVRNNTCSSSALGHRLVKPFLLCPAVHSSTNTRPSCLTTFSSHKPHMQTVTSEFLSADDLPAGTHLHLIVLNYVLPQQTAQLWHRGRRGLELLAAWAWHYQQLVPAALLARQQQHRSTHH